MITKLIFDMRKLQLALCTCPLVLAAGCGGGSGSGGNDRDSGPQQTTLSVAVSDADSDTLSYQWRATAGTVDNRNAATTVWTLPAGPGLHFAYVLVSDGRGGYSERQYAVSTDALKINAPARTAVTYAPAPAPTVADAGVVRRLRVTTPTALRFADVGAGAGDRTVYLSDTPVAVADSTGSVVVNGITDAAGELNLPRLNNGTYTVNCATMSGRPLTPCRNLTVNDTSSSVAPLVPSIGAGSNLRLYGHVGLADGGVCGTRNDYFGIHASATVQLQQADGQAVTPARRVNRFGDYFIDAAVANNTPLKLRIQCGSDVHVTDVLPGAGGFLSASPLEVSHVTGNRRPTITRMIANGQDGNVRGREVLAEAGAISNTLPGFDRFLTYKGTDTALSACMYYRAIGAVSGCNTQGGMENPITFDDWKKHHLFDTGKNPEHAATYINQRDLNLVRRMFATKVSDTQVAFYVCNNPGPEGRTQAEVNEVINFGLASERRVACVAMEWSSAPGVDGGNTPFTKFLTFGPDGSLIPSVNLDGRGEKYMPGACIACHGGSKIGGRFPERGNPSPLLGSRFLGFDTGNYLFSTVAGLTEADQGKALRDLNELVQHTEGGPSSETATSKLISGWYASGGNQLDKAYVPKLWHEAPADKALFYREVIGTSCRTCHAALGSADARFDLDSQPNLFTGSTAPTDPVFQHVCGGTSELALNGSMPNALASLDRLLDNSAPGIDALRARMKKYLGCSAPAEDPVYPRR